MREMRRERYTLFSPLIFIQKNMNAQTKIAVLGLGNILLQDEGVGVHVVKKLEKQYQFDPSVNLIDGGTSGFDLLPYFEENDKIIIVDAINFSEHPGFIGAYENDDILRRLNKKLSLHHLGLTDLLADLKLHDIEPSEIYLLGIQPSSMEMGLELSAVISAKMDRLIELVLQKMEQWNVISKKLY